MFTLVGFDKSINWIHRCSGMRANHCPGWCPSRAGDPGLNPGMCARSVARVGNYLYETHYSVVVCLVTRSIVLRCSMLRAIRALWLFAVLVTLWSLGALSENPDDVLSWFIQLTDVHLCQVRAQLLHSSPVGSTPAPRRVMNLEHLASICVLLRYFFAHYIPYADNFVILFFLNPPGDLMRDLALTKSHIHPLDSMQTYCKKDVTRLEDLLIFARTVIPAVEPGPFSPCASTPPPSIVSSAP